MRCLFQHGNPCARKREGPRQRAADDPRTDYHHVERGSLVRLIGPIHGFTLWISTDIDYLGIFVKLAGSNSGRKSASGQDVR